MIEELGEDDGLWLAMMVVKV